jgi:DnaJ-class molecular chaperone
MNTNTYGLMAKKIRCHCAGKPECKLCKGTGVYEYEVGPQGYLPFPCPTCQGKGILPNTEKELCYTCVGEGRVDPAKPPIKGFWSLLWKSFMGG